MNERPPPTLEPAEEDKDVLLPAPSSLFDISGEHPAVEATPVRGEEATSTSSPEPLGTSSPVPVATSTSRDITPESIRPYPKAPTCPLGKGRKKVRASILTEDEDAISTPRAKEDRKRKKSQKKRRAVTAPLDSTDKDEPGLTLHLDDFQSIVMRRRRRRTLMDFTHFKRRGQQRGLCVGEA